MTQIAKAQRFNYEILQTMSLDELENHKDHRRLRVFYQKGCKCIKCGIEATQLALGRGRGGLHIDVYTDDFYPLTVDHTIPKSKGGSNDIENLEPMCYDCNQKKGNKIDWGLNPDFVIKVTRKPVPEQVHNYIKETCTNLGVEVGDVVFTKVKKNKYKELGVVSKLVYNSVANREAVMIKGNNKSMFNLNKVYKRI